MEGFFPSDDFLAQLQLGLAKIEFQSERYVEAAKLFRKTYEEHPKSGAAAEASYWSGVSDYKATNDASHLKTTGQRLRENYPESEWARKASVWV